MQTRIIGKKWFMGAVALIMACFVPAGAADVTGAGASFPAPLYIRWAADYNKATGDKINYQSVGSSAGMKQIEVKTVDFGATDIPLSDQTLAEKGLIQFPTVVGGIVPIVNIRGIAPGELKLNGQLLGDIYLGKIKKWNDPAIAKLNPDLKLPNIAIAVVRRADGSGTSFVFTNYLAKVNSEWKEKVGEGAAVNWPIGMGGKGNEGVAAFVKRLHGAIGYVEHVYAKRTKLAHTQMQNQAGKYVQPSDASFRAAAAGADWAKSFNQILTDQPGDDSWPIASATFIVMHKKQDKPREAASTLAFFDWAYKNGDKDAANLDYVPMPQNVKDMVTKLWQTIVDASGKPIKK